MRKLLLLKLFIAIGLISMAQTQLPLPNHGSVYSGSARGYWFTAPTDFIIVGLRVPAQSGTGDQYIHLMKLATAAPSYPATATPITQAWINGTTNGIINTVNVPVTTGEHIGILGTANTSNSYATPSGPFNTTINGFPVTLTRFLYQGNLTAGPATAVSQEVSASLSRVEIYYVIPSAMNDAGVTSIDSPASFCSGTENIVATIRNYGVNQINPVTVNWSVNGFVQTPTTYTQTLDTTGGSGSTSAQITLGSWSFTAGQTDTIVVWTSNPNGQLDTVNTNDTSIAWLQPSLSGTFTVDTAASADYQTITAAIQDINDFGVCGPVIFNIGAGVYTGQLDLTAVQGASEVNTISFIGGVDSAGNPDVNVEYASTSSASGDAVVNTSGAMFMYFENIGFRAIGTTYQRVIDATTSSSDISFKNCQFHGDPGGTTSTFDAVLYSSSAATHENWKFHDCLFEEGSYGLYYFYGGTSTSHGDGNEFIGCSFENQYYDVFYYSRYHANFKFKNNKIRTNTTSSGFDCFYYLWTSGNTEIVGNDINVPYDVFYYLYLEGSPTESPLFANNMIVSNGGTAHYVVYIGGGASFARIINNTIIGYNSTYTYSALRINSGIGNTIMNNNIYMDKTSTSTSYAALYYASSTIADVSDYNNIYVGGSGYLAEVNNTSYSTLADLQNGTGYDTNSISTNPMFVNFDDPRTCSDTIDGAGTPISYIIDDYEGDGRDPVTPDIGADEFVGSGSYSAGDDAFVCSGKGVVIGLQSNNLDSISWSTGDTTATIKVFNPGTYNVTVKSSCGNTEQFDEVVVTDITAEANFDVEAEFVTGKFTEQAVNKDSLVWYIHTNPVDTFFSDVVTYIFPDNGPYDVTLCVYNECDTVCNTQIWVNYDGVEESSLSNNIRLMPNPATDNVNINFNGFEGDVTIELNNIQGQVVYSERYNVVSNDNKSIDVSSLNKGMYILKVMSNDEVYTKQLIVQ